MALNLDRSAWRKVKFGDVVRNVNDNVKDPAAAGIERVLGLEHLDPGELRIQRWSDVSPESTFTRRVRPGQTLFGKRRAYQRKTAYAEFDAVCSGDILVFESADTTRLLPELLPFIAMTDSFYAMALETSAGSLSPRTRWSDIAKYEFDLPPLDQQRRIADLLWGAEQHKRTLLALEASARRAAQAVRDEWFSQSTPSHETFESLCLVPSQNGLSKTKADRGGSVPMVNMGQMFLGEVIPEGGYERVALTDKERAAYLLHPGDLLFARRSIVFEGAGATCLVPTLSEDHTFESSVIRVSPDPARVRAEYLLHYFRSRTGRVQMSTIVRRGPVSGIAGSDLRRLRVPVDSLARQEKLIRIMFRAQTVEMEIRQELDAAAALANSARESILTPTMAVAS